jgi:hypothetical protein
MPTCRLNLSRWFSLICLALTGAGCRSVMPSAPPVIYETTEWKFGTSTGSILTSEHYKIYTTCRSKPFVNAMPNFVEQCWDSYAELLPPQHLPLQPLETYLFQSRWEWERFTERFAPSRAETYKHIRSGGYSERGVTVSHYSSARSALSVLAHEGLHQYLEVTHGPNIPAWLNEGLACYFESFDLDDKNRPVFKPENNTLRIPALRETLASGKLIPLRDILSTHAGAEIQKNLSHVSTYYAQEWAIVVYLMSDPHNNPYHQGFRALLADLGEDAMDHRARGYLATDIDGSMSHGEAVFRAYISDDLERFEVSFRDFLQRFLQL